MLQKHSFANLYIISYGFCRIYSWKTNVLPKQFSNSHLGKRELERKVSAVVPPPTHSYMSNGYLFSCYRCTAQNWQRERSEVPSPACAQKPHGIANAGICQSDFWLQGSCKLKPSPVLLAGARCSGNSCCSNNARQMFVPEGYVSTGSESKPVWVLCLQLL